MHEVNRAQRSPIRVAMEDGSPSDLVEALRAKTVPDGDCWSWTGKQNKGYAVFQYKVGRKTIMLAAHRMMYEAVHGSLQRVSVVHHTCANRLCIKPAHLQLIDQASNLAEMLERRYYRDRIAQLEAALRELDDKHPCLT